MAEVTGLVVGFVALSGLYTTCVQLLEQVEAGRELADAANKSQTLFEADKLLFTRRGAAVGIVGGTLGPNHHKNLHLEAERTAVFHILACIENTFKHNEALSKKYGLSRIKPQAVLPPVIVLASNIRQQTTNSAREVQQATSFRRKIVWAVKDKNKFEDLSVELAAFVERLYALVPPISLQDDDPAIRQLSDEHIVDIKDSLKDLRSSVTGIMRKSPQTVSILT